MNTNEEKRHMDEEAEISAAFQVFGVREAELI